MTEHHTMSAPTTDPSTDSELTPAMLELLQHLDRKIIALTRRVEELENLVAFEKKEVRFL